jgi:hypothetical protein
MIRRFLNGGTCWFDLIKPVLFSEYIGLESERPELKHLSKARKRKQSDFLSSGERNGNSKKRLSCDNLHVLWQSGSGICASSMQCSRQMFLVIRMTLNGQP